MRMCAVLLLMCCFPLVCFSQADTAQAKYGWQPKLALNVNLTQSHFDNWEEGGENSLAFQVTLLGGMNLTERDYTWKNSLKLDYGRAQLGKDSRTRKSTDELEVESVFTYLLNVYVNPYVSVHGRTQMYKGYHFEDDGSREQVSNFFDPGYLTESIGVGYQPVAALNTRIGFAVKETFADEFAYLYTDDRETPDEIESVRVEVGLESVTYVEAHLHENILLHSKLNVFSTLAKEPLAGSDTEELNVDVDWDTIIKGKITELINVNLNFRLYYDGQVNHKRQIKEALAIGFSYVFI